MTRIAKYYNKSPDLISQEEIQEYLLYLLQKRKLSWGTCNTHLSGLACLYLFRPGKGTLGIGVPFYFKKGLDKGIELLFGTVFCNFTW